MKFEWFGRKSRPVQTRAPAAWLSGWAASEAPRGYEALVRAAYMVNPIAQRAVRIVAEGAAGAPVLANPAGHPALKLLGGGTSGDSRTGSALIETISANLLLHGNAFVEVGLGPDGIAARARDVAAALVRFQSGYLYHYAFVMLIGVALIITYFIFAGGGLPR